MEGGEPLGLRIQLPAVLAQVAGQRTVELEPLPKTVEEALQELFRRHPGLAQEMLGPDGNLDYTYRLFLNGEGISQWQDMQRALRDGDELVILMMLAGG